MSALLKKEFSLALHPASALFVFFAAMVFIPNYPYEVMFFFSGLSAFFICLTGRENKDLHFSCVLPVEKRDVAAARVLFCMILQLAQIVLCVPFIAIKSAWINMPNLAGMEANAAFLGFGLMMLGGFNLIFFPLYFKNPNKVGKPFCVRCGVHFPRRRRSHHVLPDRAFVQGRSRHARPVAFRRRKPSFSHSARRFTPPLRSSP